MSELVKQVCFVDMPFGKKHDPKSGVEIDFDQIYEQGIEPAIISQGLQAVRADRELTGGIIHTALVQDIGDRITQTLGEPKLLERGVLIDAYLSYRAVSAWDEMIALFEQMPAGIQATALARQQLAFALNRRNDSGDRSQAIQVLEQLISDYGENAETLGILGRIYKDCYTDAKKAEDLAAEGWLDMAIETYTKGFEAEPADYYPGVNAVTLLLQKGDEQAMSEIDRLAPLVTFAAVRQGGEKANDLKGEQP